MSEDRWYYSPDGEERIGPTPGDQLLQLFSTGQLPGETLVWRPGMGEDWIPIQYVEELGGTAPVDPQAVVEAEDTPPTDQPASADVHGSDTKSLLAMLEQVKGAVPLSSKSLINMVSSKIFWFWMVAPFTVIKMLIVPAIVSRAAEVWAEGHGIELSVEDWSADLLNLSATAHNAVVLVPGPYAEEEFLSAEAIEVDLSLWSGLFGDHWTRKIQIQEPNIYVERLLSGQWNWQNLMGVPIEPIIPSALNSDKQSEDSFKLVSVAVEEMGLQWVENLPGDSKGGMIQELKTTIFVDDISVSAKNLVGLINLNPQRNSLLNLEARTAGGKISFTGKANLFYWDTAQEKADKATWMPTIEGEIYLENVGANALARLMPDAAILPDGGAISGKVNLEVTEREVICLANLNIRNATFTANRDSRFVGNNASSINTQLSGYQANGQHQFSCGGSLDQVEGEGSYRPFQAFQTNIVRQGVAQAPKTVRALATVEHIRYSDDLIDPSLQDEVNRILGKADPEWLKWIGLGIRVRNSLPRKWRPF